MRQHTGRRAALALALVAAAIGGGRAPAQAAGPFTVNNVNDLTDANPGDGACETAAGNGQCTLRAAVMEANALAGADTILLASATYTLTLGGNDSDAEVGDLDITDDLTIQGNGAALSLITVNNYVVTDGVFTLISKSLTLRALTVHHVFSTSSGAAVYNSIGDLVVEDSVLRNNQAEWGGAIYQYGAATLVLRNTQIISNSAENGGGLYVDGGTADLSGVTLRGNEASELGGGLYATDDTLGRLTDTQFFTNSADLDGGGVYGAGANLWFTRTLLSGNLAQDGGAVYNSGAITVTASTWSSNTASSQGGGLYQAAGQARLGGSTLSGNTSALTGGGIHNGTALVVFNSTLSGNRAGTSGGGLYTYAGVASFYNVTIASNLADSDYSGSGTGGGVHRAGGTLNLHNTLIGNNGNGVLPMLAPLADDCAGTVVSHGNNLIEFTAGCTITNNDASNQLGQDPVLGPLLPHNNAPRTHALLPGSPAIDAGNSEACIGPGSPTILSVDQRGVPRYADGDLNGFGLCDIGAYELVFELALPLILR